MHPTSSLENTGAVSEDQKAVTETATASWLQLYVGTSARDVFFADLDFEHSQLLLRKVTKARKKTAILIALLLKILLEWGQNNVNQTRKNKPRNDECICLIWTVQQYYSPPNYTHSIKCSKFISM